MGELCRNGPTPWRLSPPSKFERHPTELASWRGGAGMVDGKRDRKRAAHWAESRPDQADDRGGPPTLPPHTKPRGHAKGLFPFQAGLQADHHGKPQPLLRKCGTNAARSISFLSLACRSNRPGQLRKNARQNGPDPALEIEGCLDWQGKRAGALRGVGRATESISRPRLDGQWDAGLRCENRGNITGTEPIAKLFAS